MPNPDPRPSSYSPAYALPARAGFTGAPAPLAVSSPQPAPTLAAPAPEEKGWVELGLETLKNAAPELLVNFALTKGNHSQLGRQIQVLGRAPASFFVTVISGFVALATRGRGWVGQQSVTVAKGSGHATVAEIARPKAPAAPQSAGVDGSEELEAHAPTES